MVHTTPAIFTIGHSSRPLATFLGLLAESGIQCVVDVRRLPGSRSFPHYDADVLAESLAGQGIDYWYVAALGGRRSARELAGNPPETFWTNPSFARYAAYAHSEAFSDALGQLMARGFQQRCAVMCSEAVWWRCHRRIISDHLLAREVPVQHIMAPGKTDAASLTIGARIEAGKLIYPA